MTDVTDADREKAWQVLCALPISIPGYSPETVRKAQNRLAAALAEERAKARAPFLAEMRPGRWWRVVAADGSIWCETSDEDEARSSMRPGDKIQRLHEMKATEWRAAEETE